MPAALYLAMNKEIEIKSGEEKYKLVFSDKPSYWASGVYVQIYSSDGKKVSAISYSAHPEFDNFDDYKGMSVNDLVEIVLSRIESDINSYNFRLGAENGIELLLPINKKI